MKHWYYLLLLLAAGVLAGCGGPVGHEQADRLSAWLSKQSYSVYSTFRTRDGEPARPPSPDGLTLGSPNVFAAVGCNPDDLSEIDSIWGDTRTARAFGKSVTVSISASAGPDGGLAEFSRQTLRRVRHTSIAVFEGDEKGLHVRTVDFAPMGAEDNFLVRWFLVENQSDRTQRVELSLHLTGAGDWKRVSGHAYQLGEKLGLVSDQNLETAEDTLTIPLGRIGSGRRAAAALFFVVAHDAEALSRGMARAESARTDPMVLLEQTKTNWVDWCAKAPLTTGDERTDDLLDSLLCLVRTHVGPNAIHTGSVRYPHDRAWVRDNYWAQRALLELGFTREAKVGLDFFHRAWRQSGIASSYQVHTLKPFPYGYARVEFPHYFVLMVRDAETYGHVSAKDYWDMVRGCLDRVSMPESGLQPMNGDETWLLAAPVRELDDMLDNSWLLIASAEFGSKLAQRMGDHARAARYGSMAYRARLALRAFMPEGQGVDWLAAGHSADGSLDLSLFPEVYARGPIFGVLPATDPHIASGLVASWERLRFDRGLRTYSSSTTIDGGTPGYVLYAMADNPGCDSLFRRDLISRVQRFASATGCVWEFHDLHDPAWGGEKRRLWDSAVLLSGMVHALFDVQHGTRTYLVPKPDPIELSLPPEETPGFDAQELLTGGEGLVILTQDSPEHAARLARELLRHVNRQIPVESYGDAAPEDRPAIIVSPLDPPTGWLQTTTGYYTRAWGGPPQLWVKNMGHVFADTDRVLLDLLSYLPPQRATPLPYPDQDYDIAARYGEAPSGQAEIEAYWSGPYVTRTLDLAGGQTELALGATKVKVSAHPNGEKKGVMQLVLTAGRPDPVEVSVTLPAGWWLICARDVTGTWDRIADPVREDYLPDGRIRLTYSLRATTEPLGLTFDLTRLRLATATP